MENAFRVVNDWGEFAGSVEGDIPQCDNTLGGFFASEFENSIRRDFQATFFKSFGNSTSSWFQAFKVIALLNDVTSTSNKFSFVFFWVVLVTNRIYYLLSTPKNTTHKKRKKLNFQIALCRPICLHFSQLLFRHRNDFGVGDHSPVP